MRVNRGPNSTPARPTRVCRKCGVEQSLENFRPHFRRGVLRWDSYDRACRREAKRGWPSATIAGRDRAAEYAATRAKYGTDAAFRQGYLDYQADYRERDRQAQRGEAA